LLEKQLAMELEKESSKIQEEIKDGEEQLNKEVEEEISNTQEKIRDANKSIQTSVKKLVQGQGDDENMPDTEESEGDIASNKQKRKNDNPSGFGTVYSNVMCVFPYGLFQTVH